MAYPISIWSVLPRWHPLNGSSTLPECASSPALNLHPQENTTVFLPKTVIVRPQENTTVFLPKTVIVHPQENTTVFLPKTVIDLNRP